MIMMTANTMAMAARERVTEVAVMRTLGFTAGQILGIIVAESLLVSLLGAAIALGGSLPRVQRPEVEPLADLLSRSSWCRPTRSSSRFTRPWPAGS
jgi:predicted lysophospholipase L1 biosynthesis ABC-type transport system permease subunit